MAEGRGLMAELGNPRASFGSWFTVHGLIIYTIELTQRDKRWMRADV